MELRHPFLTKPKLAILYGIFWIIASVIMMLILVFANGLDYWASFVEVFSSIFIFAIIGTAIWYVTRFSTIENNSAIKVIMAHIIAASIIVFIWMYLGVVLIKLLHPESIEWMQKGLINRIFGGYTMYTIYVVFFYAVNYYFSFKEKVILIVP